MRDSEQGQYGFANSPLGEWLRRTFMTSNPTFTDKRMGLPDVGLRMGPAGQGVSAIGTQAVNPQMAQPESGYAYPPTPPDPRILAYQQKLAQDELLRAAAATPRKQMVQPESGFAYPPAPQAAPQAPQAYHPYESNYPQSYQPYESNYPGKAPAAAGIAAARPQEIKYANSPDAAAIKTGDKGMHYWLDKGDGSPLMPYYSKTGEKPELPGTFAFADPNYKPFFGLFGG
jgi:hypothetical protein